MTELDCYINNIKFITISAEDSTEEFYLDSGIWKDVKPIETNISESRAYKISIQVSLEVLKGKIAFWVNLLFDEKYRCSFLPHLSPLKHLVIGEKVLRGAPIILEDNNNIIAILPNYQEYKKEHVIPYIMDYDSASNMVSYGIGNHEEYAHTYFKLNNKEIKLEENISFSFFIFVAEKQSKSNRNFNIINKFIWDIFAKNEMVNNQPNPKDLEIYVDHTYNWAFNNWHDVSWQEFNINEQRVGGIVFILTAKQKPGLGFEDAWREPKSLWNQAWFCSLRSAYGYYNWGKEKNDNNLMEKAKLSLNFALSVPRNKGLFCSYYKADENNDITKGDFHTSAPRRPENHDGYYHLLDNSWTCYWLLKWYEDIEKDERIIPFVSDYLETLLDYQQPDGSLPAWVEPNSGNVSPYLLKSPESACHLMLFTKMYEVTKEKGFIDDAIKTANFIIDRIIPAGKWEDFETYWSCAGEWEKKQFGCVDRKSGLYNQNSFGMYWCAEGLLDLYKLTRDCSYLVAGEQVVAEFSLYQQLYRPYSFEVETLGGFGVMNSDDEWNDARQSLFALTYLKYFIETGNQMYKIKALWSMRASFYMMYCPENPETKELYERVYPFFDKTDYGFHMENYKHNDGTQNMGLGEFTIFDWGNGAACSSLYEFIKLFENCPKAVEKQSKIEREGYK